jgi:hypothetical protein
MIRLQIQPICRDSGAVLSGRFAQPLWEAEFLLGARAIAVRSIVYPGNVG